MNDFEYGMFNFHRYLRAAAHATDETTRDFYLEMAFKWRRTAIDWLIIVCEICEGPDTTIPQMYY